MKKNNLNLPFIFTDKNGYPIQVWKHSYVDYWYVPTQYLDRHSVANVTWEEHCDDNSIGDHGFVKKTLQCIEIFVDFDAPQNGDGTKENPYNEMPQDSKLKYYECMTNCCLGVVFRCSGQCTQKTLEIEWWHDNKFIIDGLQGSFDHLFLCNLINGDIKMNFGESMVNPDQPFENLVISTLYNSKIEFNYHKRRYISHDDIRSAVGCTFVSTYIDTNLNITYTKDCSITINVKTPDNTPEDNQGDPSLDICINSLALHTSINMISKEKNYDRGGTVFASSSFSIRGGDFIHCTMNMLAEHSTNIPQSVIERSKKNCGVYSVEMGIGFSISANDIINCQINCNQSGSLAKPTSPRANCGRTFSRHWENYGGWAASGGGYGIDAEASISCNVIKDSNVKIDNVPAIQSASGGTGYTLGNGTYYWPGDSGHIGMSRYSNLIPQNVRGPGGTAPGAPLPQRCGPLSFYPTIGRGGGSIGFYIDGRAIVKEAKEKETAYSCYSGKIEEHEYDTRIYEFTLEDYIQANEIIKSNINIG